MPTSENKQQNNRGASQASAWDAFVADVISSSKADIENVVASARPRVAQLKNEAERLSDSGVFRPRSQEPTDIHIETPEGHISTVIRHEEPAQAVQQESVSSPVESQEVTSFDNVRIHTVKRREESPVTSSHADVAAAQAEAPHEAPRPFKNPSIDTSSLEEDVLRHSSADDTAVLGASIDEKASPSSTFCFAFLIAFAYLAFAITLFNNLVAVSQGAPSYLYVASELVKSVQEGVVFPHLLAGLNNGVAYASLGSPLFYYLLAPFTLVGNYRMGFALYCAFVALVDIAVWLYIAKRTGHLKTCLVLASVWYVLPTNLYCLFVRGYLPASLVLALLPLVVLFAHDFLKCGGWKKLLATLLLTALIGFFDIRFALAALVVLVVAAFVLVVFFRASSRSLQLVGALLLGFAVALPVSYEALSAFISLGIHEVASALIPVCASVALCAYAITYVSKTDPYAYDSHPVIAVLIYALFAAAGLYFCFTATAVQSISSELFAEASENTSQRAFVVEGNSYRSYSADALVQTQANTSDVQLDSSRFDSLKLAFEAGQYSYFFDRCLELGCDSVLLSAESVSAQNVVPTQLSEAAQSVGYSPAAQDDSGYLFHYNAAGTSFGTTCEYKALGIGSNAQAATRFFPVMQVGSSQDINDYTFTYLSNFDVVYLDGFVYSSKAEAEELLKKVSLSGTRVLICADSMPADERTGEDEFLGVNVASSVLSNSEVTLSTRSFDYKLGELPSGYSSWSGATISGVSTEVVTIQQGTSKLCVLGSTYKDGIWFMGADLVHLASVMQSDEATILLELAFNLKEGVVPQRSVVNTNVQLSASALSFSTRKDSVSTGYYAHDHGISLSVDAGAASTIDGLYAINSGSTSLLISSNYSRELELTILCVVLSALYVLAIWGWELHLARIEEIAAMAKDALEAARVSTTSVATELEPSDWSQQDWTEEQIKEWSLEQSQEKTMPAASFISEQSVPTIEELVAVYNSISASSWHNGSDAAQVVANYLSKHPRVLEVRYAGLKSDPLFEKASQTLYGGFGPYVWYRTAAGTKLLDCTNCVDVKDFILSLEKELA